MEYDIIIPQYSEELSKHMYQLQQKGVLCDAWLVCKDGKVFIHKLILMSTTSPYLQQQVTAGSQSNATKCHISLEDYCFEGKPDRPWRPTVRSVRQILVHDSESHRPET